MQKSDLQTLKEAEEIPDDRFLEKYRLQRMQEMMVRRESDPEKKNTSEQSLFLPPPRFNSYLPLSFSLTLSCILFLFFSGGTNAPSFW